MVVRNCWNPSTCTHMRLSRLSLGKGMMKGRQKEILKTCALRCGDFAFWFRNRQSICYTFLYCLLWFLLTLGAKNQREYHAVYCMRNHGCTLMRRTCFRLVACVLINSTERSTNREGTGQMIVHTVFWGYLKFEGFFSLVFPYMFQLRVYFV